MWGLHSRKLAYINNIYIYWYLYMYTDLTSSRILNTMWNGWSTGLIQKSLRCELNPKHIWNPHVHQHPSVVESKFKRNSIRDVLSVGSPQQNASIFIFEYIFESPTAEFWIPCGTGNLLIWFRNLWDVNLTRNTSEIPTYINTKG